eukprot:COSAG05_NODE_2379_length_3154_cov_3.363993_2_plen_45_part_00
MAIRYVKEEVTVMQLAKPNATTEEKLALSKATVCRCQHCHHVHS